MTDDRDGPGLWLVLLGFLVFCAVIGWLLGLAAYGVVRDVFGAF